MSLTAENIASLNTSRTSRLDAFLASLPLALEMSDIDQQASVSSKTVRSPPRPSRPISNDPWSPYRRPPSVLDTERVHEASSLISGRYYRKRRKRKPRHSETPSSSTVDYEHLQRLQQRKHKRQKLKDMRKDKSHPKAAIDDKRERTTREREGSHPRRSRADEKEIGEGKTRKQKILFGIDNGTSTGQSIRRKMMNVNRQRITLQEQPKYGVFNKGAASSKVIPRQQHGVPDLAFHEYSFLSRPSRQPPLFLPTAVADLTSKLRSRSPDAQQSHLREASEASLRPHKPSVACLHIPSRQKDGSHQHAPLFLDTSASEAPSNENNEADSDLSEAHSARSLKLRRRRKAVMEAKDELAEVSFRAAVGAVPARIRPPPSFLLSPSKCSQRPQEQSLEPPSASQRPSLDTRGHESCNKRPPVPLDFPPAIPRIPSGRKMSTKHTCANSSAQAHSHMPDRASEMPESMFGPDYNAPVLRYWKFSEPSSGSPKPERKHTPRSTSVSYERYNVRTLSPPLEGICMDGWGSAQRVFAKDYCSDTHTQSEHTQWVPSRILKPQGSSEGFKQRSCPPFWFDNEGQSYESHGDITERPAFSHCYPSEEFCDCYCPDEHVQSINVPQRPDSPTDLWSEVDPLGHSDVDDIVCDVAYLPSLGRLDCTLFDLEMLAMPEEQCPPTRFRAFLQTRQVLAEQQRQRTGPLEDADTINFWHCIRS